MSAAAIFLAHDATCDRGDELLFTTLADGKPKKEGECCHSSESYVKKSPNPVNGEELEKPNQFHDNEPNCTKTQFDREVEEEERKKTEAKSAMTYPDDIDMEIVPLLDELNSLEGIETKFSCSGHEKVYEDDGMRYSNFYIVFESTSIRSLNIILNSICLFNDMWFEEHGYIMTAGFITLRNRYRENMDMDAVTVDIRCRKCHHPLKFSHLEELRKLIVDEKEKSK